jgi:hypothetical protein
VHLCLQVKVYDIGGSKELQEKWPLLFGEVKGFIWTIDWTNRKDVMANLDCLKSTLTHPDVEGKPFLIVATKTIPELTIQEDFLYNDYTIETLLSRHKNTQFCVSDLSDVLTTPESEEEHVMQGNISVNDGKRQDSLKAPNSTSPKGGSHFEAVRAGWGYSDPRGLFGSVAIWIKAFLSAATLVAADYGFTCPLRFMSVVCVLLLGRTKIAISQPCTVRLS